VFSAVAEETRRLLGAYNVGIGRFEPDGAALVVVGDAGPLMVPVGTRLELRDYDTPAVVWRTGRAAEDVWLGMSDPVAEGFREMGRRSMVASPINVEGRLWGVVNAATRRGSFPPGSADQLADFTEGDEPTAPIGRLGTTGVFTSTLREALLHGAVDLVVHSAKDLPTATVPGLQIAAFPAREDPRDALIWPGGTSLDALPHGARIGTGSPRRAALLRAVGRHLQIVPIRGNVDTRLRKLADGQADALVLAMAGLSILSADRDQERRQLIPVGVVSHGAIPASRNAAARYAWHHERVSIRCLIVDDSAAFLKAASVLLQREGVIVVGVASNSAEALRLAGALRSDVILVDIGLGKESGFDLARLLALDGQGGGAEVILISARAEADYAELIAESPAAGFLVKSDLSARAISRILAARRERRPTE